MYFFSLSTFTSSTTDKEQKHKQTWQEININLSLKPNTATFT